MNKLNLAIVTLNLMTTIYLFFYVLLFIREQKKTNASNVADNTITGSDSKVENATKKKSAKVVTPKTDPYAEFKGELDDWVD